MPMYEYIGVRVRVSEEKREVRTREKKKVVDGWTNLQGSAFHSVLSSGDKLCNLPLFECLQM